jgi:hypothetical protein
LPASCRYEIRLLLLPWLAERLMSPGTADADVIDSRIERDERDQRDLFVGVACARDYV